MSSKNQRPRGSNMPAPRYSGDYIVSSFLDYFEKAGHRRVPSASLVPDDPTLLFTAAGMVPFKAYYSAPESAPYPTAASVQKCLRAGGKQSDLENVGRTLRHHTFFEMLGNFSFGDYFKKEAIDFGWELSVDVWGMDGARIWVSVYQDDDDAFDLWEKRIGIPTNRIVRLGKSDNFWGPVGDTGVCGPSSELYYDTGEARGCGRDDCQPGCDCDRFIEFWNLVFPQFFFTEAGAYDPLPKPGIDTGMGLERVAFILQGAEDNFHTDLFLPIRRAIERAVPPNRRDEARLAINVGADHVRALVFALSDGVMPSNEGRGYVLRRLLRRALTKMHPFGVREPFLAPAVDAVVDTMGGRYPELGRHQSLVRDIITSEEERFLRTVEQGLNKLDEVIERARSGKHRTVSGEDAFVLYDTYGFPFELTKELAEDAELDVDETGYLRAMEAQRERGRGESFHRGGAGEDAAAFTELESASSTTFLGYDRLSCDARVTAYRVRVDDDGAFFEVATDETVFYPEGGGQIGDSGTLTMGDAELRIVDTFRSEGRIVHRALWTGPAATMAADARELVEKNRSVKLTVDRATRLATARNHTATHLLHASLRRVLGTHVSQAGSLVAPDRLRFDFHHHQAVGDGELRSIQDMVNDKVLDDLDVSATTMPFKEAIATGAMALFGEKYTDTVRVVSIDGFSKELCGGTHLRQTGEIGTFLITHETAVAAGVRRIEALTGKGALRHYEQLLEERNRLAGILKTSPEDLDRRARALVEENESLRLSAMAQDRRAAGDQVREAIEHAEKVGDIDFITLIREQGDVGALRRLADQLREKMPRGVGLLFLATAKPVVLIIVSDSLLADDRVSAKELTAAIAREFSLKGGGKAHMAQLGVTSADDFEKLRTYVREVLRSTS